MKKSTPVTKKHIFGIDALRTIGLLGVIFYHVTPRQLPGGNLAVLIFFVLTGFLLTRSLLLEYQVSEKISWKKFFFKRLKRIYPLMIIIFLFVSAFFFIFQPKMLVGMREAFLSSIFSVNNWWQIVNGSSYFSNYAQAANNAFKHIYFLSIEGQFILVLALLLLILPKKRASKLSVSVLVLLSLVSAFLMAYLFKASDPTRVYYGTDTRLFALLIGAALAFVELDKAKLKKGIATVTALICFLGILTAMIFLPDKLPFIYQGGMYFFSLLVALLVWLLSASDFAKKPLLTNSAFKYLGSRSYAIYLWQLPVFAIVENCGINISLWYNVLWELLLILVLSEISYHFVEKPFSELSFAALRKYFTQKLNFVRKFSIFALIFISTAGLAVILISPSQSADVASLKKRITANQLAAESRNRELLEKQRSKASTGSTSSSSSTQNSVSSSAAVSSSISSSQHASSSAPGSTSSSASSTTESRPATTAIDPANYPMVAVGDSVLLDVANSLQHTFPQMYLDGEVGRQADEAANVLQTLPPAALTNAKSILMELGVNGEITDADIAAVMQAAAGRPVFWVNVRVPRTWEAADNTTLVNAAKIYPNLHILDWYSLAVNHPEYFVSDQVHLTAAGIAAYVQLVTQGITTQ